MENAERELLARARRTETRLVKLMKAQGVEPDIQGSDLTVDTATREVAIPTLDTAFVDVVNAARRAGLHGVHVTVWCDGANIATIKV